MLWPTRAEEPQGPHSQYFTDGGRGRGQRDFLGSETLAKRDLFRSMKDVGIFLGREKTRVFWVVYF